MAEERFLAAVAQITAGDLGLAALITAAGEFAAGGRPDLASQLYKVWIGFNPADPNLFAARFNCATLLSRPWSSVR